MAKKLSDKPIGELLKVEWDSKNSCFVITARANGKVEADMMQRFGWEIRVLPKKVKKRG